MTTKLYHIHHASVLVGLQALADNSVQCVVTSPPYWQLRDYGVEGQLGLELAPTDYVTHLVDVFREVRRVLRHDGVLWLNIGDSYSGSGKGPAGNIGKRNNAQQMSGKHVTGIVPDGLKPKDLIGIPWRLAFALQADGWYLRSDCIWSKPNPMPESCKDRPTKSHEYVFLLTKSAHYYYDHQAIAEPACSVSRRNGRAPHQTTTRNRRSVWHIPTQPFKGAHFAVMPEKLATICILAGSRSGDTVLDPFTGSGTTGVAALKHNRLFVGIELNAEYVAMARDRLAAVPKEVELPLDH